MKKHVATVDIYLTEGGIYSSRAQYVGPERGVEGDEVDSYSVMWTPQNDKYITASHGIELTPQDATSILAHELGHVIAMIVEKAPKDPRFSSPLDLLRAERRAWEIGEQINPKINQELRAKALSTYEREVPNILNPPDRGGI
jgi:hypothetical protein